MVQMSVDCMLRESSRPVSHQITTKLPSETGILLGLSMETSVRVCVYVCVCVCVCVWKVFLILRVAGNGSIAP